MYAVKRIYNLKPRFYIQKQCYSDFLDAIKNIQANAQKGQSLRSRLTSKKQTKKSNIPLTLTTTKILKETADKTQLKNNPNKDKESENEDKISNRQLMKALVPDPKIIEMLDQENLGAIKPSKYSKPPVKPIKRESIKLKTFNFAAGATSSKSFPPETVPEVAFIGRSNVGKSTLLNLIGNATIARVSDKPGATQQLNFYNSGLDFILVDMPGYGFAHTVENKKESWLQMIDEYIRTRKTLKRVMLLLDARHGIKIADQEFIKALESKKIKYQVVLTKCDAVKRKDLAKIYTLVENSLKSTKNCLEKIHLTSAEKNQGIEVLKRDILHSLGLGKKFLAGMKKSETISKIKYERVVAKSQMPRSRSKPKAPRNTEGFEDTNSSSSSNSSSTDGYVSNGYSKFKSRVPRRTSFHSNPTKDGFKTSYKPNSAKNKSGTFGSSASSSKKPIFELHDSKQGYNSLFIKSAKNADYKSNRASATKGAFISNTRTSSKSGSNSSFKPSGSNPR